MTCRDFIVSKQADFQAFLFIVYGTAVIQGILSILCGMGPLNDNDIVGANQLAPRFVDAYFALGLI